MALPALPAVLTAAKALMGGKTGLALTGLSVGLPMLGALNANSEDPLRDPGANLAGGVGALAGGLGTAAAAPLLMPGNRFRNHAMRFAAVPVGAMLGGGLASGTYSGVKGLFSNPLDSYINQVSKMSEAQSRAEADRMNTLLAPTYRAGLAAQDLQRRQDMDRARLAAMLSYQQGALAAGMGSPGIYNDPGFSQSLATIASGALG